jgi:hypothetical protein
MNSEVPTFNTTNRPDPTVETLVLYYPDRMNAVYTDTNSITAVDLTTKVNLLAANGQVNGEILDLGSYPDVVAAYAQWDANLGNPQSANFVARTLKSLIYSTLPAYPELKYIVLLGGDDIIPHRRIQDTVLVSNENEYPYYDSVAMRAAAQFNYYLSDDYYAASLPIAANGKEIYIPQYGIGRLVEEPQDIATMIDTFLAAPTLAPESALITGYDFLIDQAEEISTTISTQGVPTINALIDNTWTSQDFRDAAFDASTYDLISLNSHFDHFRFFPNDPNDVYATEFENTDNVRGKLIFSVGCHAGLNVPNAGTTLAFTGLDYAEAFAGKGATFIGNTGFGYGDGDLLAYSERLMLNFTQNLGFNPVPYQESTLPTVGLALTEAKQRYINELGNGAITNYDVKILEEMTLYGLPMLRIDMPVQSDVPPAGESVFAGDPLPLGGGPAQANTWEENLTFSYTAQNVNTAERTGTYYTIDGEDGLQTTGIDPFCRNEHQLQFGNGGCAWRFDGRRDVYRPVEL